MADKNEVAEKCIGYLPLTKCRNVVERDNPKLFC
jgi:hypothetical protein